MQSGTFDEILSLEEQFYDDGYRQGLSDGVKAGRIEGRTFGLEKGFEKYVQSGKLRGKSLIWANRMHQNQQDHPQDGQRESTPLSHDSQDSSPSLPSLHCTQRLEKHIKVLYALSESQSISTENTEEAVADFDDRFKRAQAKAKIIERMVGEVIADSGLPARQEPL